MIVDKCTSTGLGRTATPLSSVRLQLIFLVVLVDRLCGVILHDGRIPRDGNSRSPFGALAVNADFSGGVDRHCENARVQRDVIYLIVGGVVSRHCALEVVSACPVVARRESEEVESGSWDTRGNRDSLPERFWSGGYPRCTNQKHSRR